jgi:superfamily I DNA/RNA helicase
MGLCKEAIPGERREEYHGTEIEFREEQKRLFYVSITRTKNTLVLSRANSISRGEASQLGLQVKSGKGFRAGLEMSPFLRDIMQYLPNYQLGENWKGCLTP